MTRQQILDLDYLDTRCKLIDIAAFLDRVDRAEGDVDFRLAALKAALKQLAESTAPDRAAQTLLAFSDRSTEPIAKAPGKSAMGAWAGATETN